MSIKPISKATIERLLESQGASETRIQAVCAEFDKCGSEKERSDLLSKIKRKSGGAAKSAQTKEAKGGATKSKVAKASKTVKPKQSK